MMDRGGRGRSGYLGGSLMVALLACTALTQPVAAADDAARQQVQAQQAQAQQAQVQQVQVQQVQAGDLVSFAIPSQPLATALDAFSVASGWQVGYAADLTRGLQSPGLQGRFTPEEGLRRLLAGTRIVYRVTGPRTVLLSFEETEDTSGLPEDATLLDSVMVSSRLSSDPADVPYETPGSSVYISREEIDRVPPATMGDIFKSTSGVISAGNRSGSGLDVNIRGLQGMNRVATLVDGTQQSTSNYIGYRGNTSSTYIDPDFIGGIDITKGPSDGAYGAGSMGGVVYIRTLEAGDIVREGESYGFRLRGSIGTNSVAPVIGSGTPEDESAHPFAGDSYSFNVAGALLEENYEFILALSKRKQGNYLAGKNGGDTINGAALSPFAPGKEVFNTSEDSRSLLTKGKVLFGDGHSIEIGYIYYENDHGQLDDYQIVYPQWVPLQQYELTHTVTHTLTGKYAYQPADNDLVDLSVNAWMSHLSDDLYSAGGDLRSILTYGSEIYNRSLVATPLGDLALNYGGSFSRESAKGPETFMEFSGIPFLISVGPEGKRTIGSVFGQASLALTEWLTVAGGLRYDSYEIQQAGYLKIYPDQDGSRLNPSASVTVTPFEGLQLYGLYAEGWRPPSLREASFILGTTLLPNPDLKPEVSYNFEFGVNLLRDSLLVEGDVVRFKASYFHNNYDDYIVRYSERGSSPYTWSNIEQAKFRGLEFSGAYDMGLVFAEGSITHYTKVEYCFASLGCAAAAAGTDYGADYVPPKTSASVTLGGRLLDETLVMGLRATINSGRAIDSKTVGGFVSPTQWPSSAILDLFASYEITDNVMANLSIENLTNQYYLDPLSITGVPSPGLTARMGLSFTF